ncbi:MAG TPA: UvrD-helicase domain-containing protein [Mariniphaga sp.]|nr:UvrD-helicase domain-containing protein [Mariniphaga sp.]
MLTVYKASAGSGKTFQLVGEYLKLIMKNPQNYKNILAVTFTNKATTEMKNRILEQLNLLSGSDDSPYIPMLMSELSLNNVQIRSRSKFALKNILHDYSRFSISTIDAFTQRIIKAFNREMGISPYFVLELDNDMILEEAVDKLLSRVDTDLQLRNWLVEFSREKIMENRSQQIDKDILHLGKELFKEKFQIFFPEDDKTAYTRENINDLRAQLDKIIAVFEHTLQSKAKECMQHIENNGFTVEDFSYKSTGVAGYINNLAAKNFKEPKTRVTGAAESTQVWIAKKHAQKLQLEQLVEEKLRPLLKNILVYYFDNEIRYYTAVEVKKHLRILGILTDLKEEIRKLLHEKGLLQLSDSNLLLSKIIGDSDSPFVYEKIGNHYDYYMLDEFQDTSQLQWNNFKPLVSNALSEGNKVLLVGDVKQAIYRWRNSDWNILASRINSDFPLFPPATISLEKNWRSRRNIIEFNNNVLKALLQIFEISLFKDIESRQYLDKFKNVYREYYQEPGKPEAESEGWVNIQFLEDEEFKKHSALLLVDQVKKLQDKGLNASDIAILIRKKEEGAVLVETFMEAARDPHNEKYNLTVLSNESLFLYASKGVNFIILIIELLIDPEGKIQKTALLYLWLSWLKPFLDNKVQSSPGSDTISSTSALMNLDSNDMFESELGSKFSQIEENIKLSSLDEAIIRICKSFGLFTIGSELPFIQSLIDRAAELKTSLSNDLSNFLFWWKTKGYNTSVNINDEVDSIRLLTIHKSKGLEFEAVLIPFFTFTSSWPAQLAPILWCTPAMEPFNQFPLLPVKANSQLVRTIFKEDYLEEKVNYLIDTLNLIYVAITRARSVLIIHCQEPVERKDGEQGTAVNALLQSALSQMGLESKFAGCWRQEDRAFSFGALPEFISVDSASENDHINTYIFNNLDDRIRLKLNSEGFIIDGLQSQSVKNSGKLIHEILSKVNVADDVELICNKYLAEGIINSAEGKVIVKVIQKGFENPMVKKWFDGNYEVLNERNLLTAKGVLRPDRIMISGNKAIVADYKWGDVKLNDYNSQVSGYAHILKKSGYEHVEGYIWYINLGEVEKVCDLR